MKITKKIISILVILANKIHCNRVLKVSGIGRE